MLPHDLRIKLDHNQFIEIDKEKIKQLSRFIDLNDSFKKYNPYNWNDSNFWILNEEGEKEVSQFFTFGNAINFRYWDKINDTYTYWNGKKGGISVRGARFMWKCLKIAYENNLLDIFNCNKISHMENDEFKKMFSDDQGNTLIPHLEERIKNWKDLGLKLYEYWDSEFYNIIKESNNSLYEFIQLSRQFRAFDDPLCKMIMVNCILHSGRKIVNFKEPLFPGIDYQLIKENLRIGVLTPSKRTANKIKKMEILEKNEARELRNACLEIFLEIMKQTGINGEILDNKWWLNSKYCTDEQPVCQDPNNAHKCIFLDICEKNIDFKIPLENTRYY